MNDFTFHLARIREKMAAAAQRAGRDPLAIELIAVTKTHPAEAVREALHAGLIHLGENKVQEARAKIESVGRGIWHLIGHLQTNKVREAVQLFHFIDSVDRLDLAREIDRRADAIGKTQDILLQVNIARESTKFGCAPEEALALAGQLNALPRLALHGLMTIAPYADDPERSRPFFAGLRELRDRLQTETGLDLPVLSMGMSGDYEVAIEEGATSVRIGTALFGQRLTRRQQQPEDPGFLEST